MKSKKINFPLSNFGISKVPQKFITHEIKEKKKIVYETTTTIIENPIKP